MFKHTTTAALDSYLPFCPLPGLLLGTWCLRWGKSKLATSDGAHEWHCVGLCPPLSSISSSQTAWRKQVGGRDSLVCGGYFPVLLGWAGLVGAWAGGKAALAFEFRIQ